ncbi:glycosyltransferase [Pendulispora albinea]|uniref:Glycosyltransferase n=1 Tax=Pendulispora albinea TaxID=2741071 RepID=A0ABZ2LRB4_9BACT
MSGLRIVMAMIEPPLPLGNAAGRWYYVLLRELVRRGHRVTAFACCSNPADFGRTREYFPSDRYDLRLYGFPERGGARAKLDTLRRPYSYMWSEELAFDFEAEVARGCDVIHLEQLWAAWLALKHVEKTLVNVHYFSFIDQAEIRDRDPRAWSRRQLNFWAERRLVRTFRRFRSCSSRIATEIERLNPRSVVDTVPFGIDASLYDYVPAEKRGEAPRILLTGSMGWHPSSSAAIRLLERLWPEISRRVPDAQVDIVGWEAKRVLGRYVGMDRVNIEENVPSTRPYFERASVLLYAPSRGSGMKMKVLEAMGYGIPVVTTTEGVEGLAAVDGVHAAIADDDEALIERTVALLASPARQNAQRESARRLLETYCGPSRTVDEIEAIYARMTAGA